MAEHHLGEGYNARNPVPTIKGFQQEELARRERAQELLHRQEQQRQQQQQALESKEAAPAVGPLEGDEYSDAAKSNGGLDEKERLKKAAAPKGKPTEFEAKGRRRVTDPVTGGHVIVEDSTLDAQVQPEKLDARFPEPGFSTNVVSAASAPQLDTANVAPNPAQPSNVLLQPFPEPVPTQQLGQLKRRFDELALALAGALALVWFFVAFGAGWTRFLLRTTLIAGVGTAGWFALHIQYRKIEKSLEAARTDMHRKRGEKFSPPMPESVEWLNGLLAVAWKQLDPAIFAGPVDMVEDIMQQSLPGVISEIKISDVGLGDHPLRFVSWRGLADLMGDKEYPRADWIEGQNGGTKDGGAAPSSGKGEEKIDSDGDGVADEDESGDFLCLETSFSYSASPGSKAKNLHLLLTFFINTFDLFRIPINIWAQIEALSGTVRMRLQFVQQPPYVRLVKISLMGVPRVEASVTPLSKVLPNVLDLPLISGFVQSAIAAAANQYVAPRSLTLNLAEILSGSGVKQDTEAIGVLAVQIIRGENLSAQDTGGSSDPYVVLSLAKFGRPLYSSRIIFEDLEPCWNETGFILVRKEDVRDDEVLSIQLWDSDLRTADDIVGRAQRSVRELVHGATLNKWQTFRDELKGFEDADRMQGAIHYRVGFFEKAEFDAKLKKRKTLAAPEAPIGKSASAADASHSDEPLPVKTDETGSSEPTETKDVAPGEKEEKAAAGQQAADDAPADALNCPPDPRWPSGILLIHVHHILGLESREVEKGVSGKEREGTAGQDVSASDERDNLPNAYVEAVLNDELAFRSRTKMLNNAPIFEAGTELFVRDWRRAQVRIVVRDARVREHDPIMGIISLPLAEFFSEASARTALSSLGDGVGYGKVQYTLVMRPVRIDLPKASLGWNTATVELLSDIRLEGKGEWQDKLQKHKITVSTGDMTKRLKLGGGASNDGSSGDDDSATHDVKARLPVYDRHSSQLTFTIGGSGLSIGSLGKPEAVAVASLAELDDDEETDLELDVLANAPLKTLSRNHIDATTIQTHKADIVGKLRVRVRVDAGLDEDHEALARRGGAKDRHEFQTWDRVEGMPKTAEQDAAKAETGDVGRSDKRKMAAHDRQALWARERGAMGYKPARTAKWAADSLRDKARSATMKLAGKKSRDQTVESEA